MRQPRVELKNGYVIAIILITLSHTALNALFLHTWWSMIVFMVISTTPIMNPDRFLTLMWAAEFSTALLVAFAVIRGHVATSAFVAWSLIMIFICVKRMLHQKTRKMRENVVRN